MELVARIFLIVHVVAGFGSLGLFWVPIFTKKGGINHRKVGMWYVYLMWVVVATAAILSVFNLFEKNYYNAAFLGFLSFLSANPLWYGIAILDQKKGVSDSYRYRHFAFNIWVFAAGAGLIIYGAFFVEQGVKILMMIFGGLGISSGGQIISDYKKGLGRRSWFQDHYKGMISSGIAAYTAFFAFGGRSMLSFLPGYWQVLPWVLPSVIGIASMRILDRYYHKKKMIKSIINSEAATG